MNADIKEIFKNATYPIQHLTYDGSQKTYVVWTITGESPSLKADDNAVYSTVSVDFDIYSTGNYGTILADIKAKMKNNDWIWTEDSSEMYEEDTGLYHITTSYEKERSI